MSPIQRDSEQAGVPGQHRGGCEQTGVSGQHRGAVSRQEYQGNTEWQ